MTAYIDLKEGDRMLTVLRGVDPDKPEEIQIGAPVRVEFEQANDEVHMPFGAWWRASDAGTTIQISGHRRGGRSQRDRLSRRSPVTALQLHIEAIKNLSDQTGMPIARHRRRVFHRVVSELCEHLGITPKYIDTTAVGGCSFEMHVHHAMAAIHAGIIDIALVSHGENGHSARKIGGRGSGNYGRAAARHRRPRDDHGVWLGGAPSGYAHAMVRHMHRYGTRARTMPTSPR